jgi:hypothetical protein
MPVFMNIIQNNEVLINVIGEFNGAHTDETCTIIEYNIR